MGPSLRQVRETSWVMELPPSLHAGCADARGSSDGGDLNVAVGVDNRALRRVQSARLPERVAQVVPHHAAVLGGLACVGVPRGHGIAGNAARLNHLDVVVGVENELARGVKKIGLPGGAVARLPENTVRRRFALAEPAGRRRSGGAGGCHHLNASAGVNDGLANRISKAGSPGGVAEILPDDRVVLRRLVEIRIPVRNLGARDPRGLNLLDVSCAVENIDAGVVNGLGLPVSSAHSSPHDRSVGRGRASRLGRQKRRRLRGRSAVG